MQLKTCRDRMGLRNLETERLCLDIMDHMDEFKVDYTKECGEEGSREKSWATVEELVLFLTLQSALGWFKSCKTRIRVWKKNCYLF